MAARFTGSREIVYCICLNLGLARLLPSPCLNWPLASKQKDLLMQLQFASGSHKTQTAKYPWVYNL